VAGIDLNGRTRVSADHQCAVGAFERDLFDYAAAALTFDHTQDFRHCLMWLLILLLLVAFTVGLVWRIRKRT